MFDFFKNEEGFTLIEMLIVILIMSILLLIAVPNMTKNNTVVKEKSCEATIQLLQSQVAAFEVEHSRYPVDFTEMKDNNYIDKSTCPNDEELILENGKVLRPSEVTTP
ncbi:competence type IV pilus major pilin ComGC [Pseudalkalibacillus sp. SCS-8]|uniref:competence type IV pilus major pilin ComGC n=1 Tax=Pseudalkalibacillus nanhaiensis TaxID=3115291 RepID=UPI0032DAFF3A